MNRKRDQSKFSRSSPLTGAQSCGTSSRSSSLRSRFLGSLSPAAELQVHDAIAAAIGDQSDSKTSVFSISSGLWPSDLDHVLSRCVERVAVTLCQWLGESSGFARRTALPFQRPEMEQHAVGTTEGVFGSVHSHHCWRALRRSRVVKIFKCVEGSRSSMMDVEDEHNHMRATFGLRYRIG